MFIKNIIFTFCQISQWAMGAFQWKPSRKVNINRILQNQDLNLTINTTLCFTFKTVIPLHLDTLYSLLYVFILIIFYYLFILSALKLNFDQYHQEMESGSSASDTSISLNISLNCILFLLFLIIVMVTSGVILRKRY